MAENVTNWFRFFAYQTGILDDLAPFRPYGYWVLLALGALALLLGFRTYRPMFSALLFMVIATVTSILLRGRTDWGSITTCFTVIGVPAVFMAWFWFRLDGCLLCALLAACMGWTAWPRIWVAVVCALAGLLLTLSFPVLSIDLMTAAAGTWLLCDLSPQLLARFLPQAVPQTRLACTLTALAVGFGFQYLTTLRQKIFKKRRPDRVTRWLEERERRRKHAGYADSFSEGN